MAYRAGARLALTWAGLTAITFGAWVIGAQHSTGSMRPDAAVAAGAIGIAVIKVRVILREFMDVRRASALLRHLSDGCLLLFAVAELLAYLMTQGAAPTSLAMKSLPMIEATALRRSSEAVSSHERRTSRTYQTSSATPIQRAANHRQTAEPLSSQA